MSYRSMLNAGYLSPVSVIDDIYNSDKYYFLWLGVRDVVEDMPTAMKRECHMHLRHFSKSSLLPAHLRGVLRAVFCRFVSYDMIDHL